MSIATPLSPPPGPAADEATSWVMAMDEDERRFQVRTLTALLGLLVVLFMATLWLDLRHGVPGTVQYHLAVGLGIVGAFVLLRRDHLRSAWAVMLTIVGAALLMGALANGGTHARQVSALMIIVVVAGRMLGPRVALLATLAVALAVLGMGIWPDAGARVEAAAGEPPLRRAVAIVMQCAALGLMCWYMFRHNAQQIVKLRAAREVAQSHAEQARQAQQALLASEQRFQDFARASGDWFWETDPSGRFTWISDVVELHTGVSPATIYERTRAGMGEVDPATTQEPWKSHFAALAARQPFRDFVYSRQGPKGTQWLSSSGVPVFDAEGDFRGYRGTGVDVTARVRAEERANQAATHLREAVEELDEAFVMCDPQERIVLANRCFREVNPEVVQALAEGGRFEDYLRRVAASGRYVDAHGREEAFVQERLAWWREGCAPYESERADGRRMWIKAQRLPDGSMVMTAADITARSHAEEELRRNQRLLTQVIDAIPMAIFAKDLDSNYILANRYHLDLMQTTREQFLGSHTSVVNAPDATRIASLRDDRWVFEHRQPLVQPERTLQAADGRWVPFHSTKLPLFDEHGALVGLLGINRDISGELRAQEALRASEARFSALFHRSVVPQVVVGYDGEIVGEDVNQAFLDLTGHTRDKLMPPGNAALVLFASEEERARVHEAMSRGDTDRPLDLRIYRADGALRTLQVSSFAFETPEGLRMACAFTDVTDQREAQRQLSDLNRILEQAVHERTEALTRSNAELQAALRELEASKDALVRAERLAALGRIVAGVAHELNTPIGNSLLSATTLSDATREFQDEVARGLRRTRLDAYVAVAGEASAILQRNLERAAELVRGFKQLAMDRASSQRRRFSLAEVVEEFALAHRPVLRRAGVELLQRIAPGPELDSYPGPLGQVLTNLVDNALLHAYAQRDPGPVEIASEAEDEHHVVLTVRDFGRGIGAADLGRIFDPFFTTRLGKGGSGLGLHIVHNLVREVLGGEITVASAPGEGTTFRVILPYAAPWPRKEVAGNG